VMEALHRAEAACAAWPAQKMRDLFPVTEDVWNVGQVFSRQCDNLMLGPWTDGHVYAILAALLVALIGLFAIVATIWNVGEAAWRYFHNRTRRELA